MRRFTATFALALLLLLGCDATSTDRVELLTGLDSCYAGAQSPNFGGLLISDPEYGTRIDGRPVMWPSGYTGRRVGTEVEVVDQSGNLVARTGREYRISPAPVPGGEAGLLFERIGAVGAPNCYPWDFVDCAAVADGTGDPAEAPYCPPIPAYDVAAVKSSFEDECEEPVALEDTTCDQIDIAGMHGDRVRLIVPTTGMHRDRKRAFVVCQQIASAHRGVNGEPLGFETVIIEGKNNKRLAECAVA